MCFEVPLIAEKHPDLQSAWFLDTCFVVFATEISNKLSAMVLIEKFMQFTKN